MDFFGGGYYPVYADFNSVSGLDKGATVEIAGVDVGIVDAITLEPKSDMAKVRMEIKDGVKLKEDVVASIRAQGIVGDDYMSISPGESGRIIPPGRMNKAYEVPHRFRAIDKSSSSKGRSSPGKIVHQSVGKPQFFACR